jgi:hypothetical protein
MKKLFTVSLVIFVLASAFLSDAEAVAGTYTTNFPLTENPISEGGKWTNGKTDGLDWADVRTTPGLAFGTQDGSGGYDDSTALVTGTWGADQTVQATLYNVVPGGTACCQEVELRLRSSISAHSCTGYEVLFSANPSNQYVAIVKWLGALNSFANVTSATGVYARNGDVVKVTIAGTSTVTITAYVNGVQVLQGTDTNVSGVGPWMSGKPGMGFDLKGATGMNGDYGFTSFTASDESGASSAGGDGGGGGSGGCFIDTVGDGTLTSAGRWIVLGLIEATFASLLSLRITN